MTREPVTRSKSRGEEFGGKLIGHNDPDYQEKVVKFNELIANCVIYSTACDITDAANQLAAEGHTVDTDDLATISVAKTRATRYTRGGAASGTGTTRARGALTLSQYMTHYVATKLATKEEL
ncbi:Tn3 family transposase [Microtetraspora glauca]|uniref:Tn3 family transposase n=1 Tax=Microtetraspora glauca TaxID=1996 RepID=A0ABV3GKC8_MICGL